MAAGNTGAGAAWTKAQMQNHAFPVGEQGSQYEGADQAGIQSSSPARQPPAGAKRGAPRRRLVHAARQPPQGFETGDHLGQWTPLDRLGNPGNAQGIEKKKCLYTLITVLK